MGYSSRKPTSNERNSELVDSVAWRLSNPPCENCGKRFDDSKGYGICDDCRMCEENPDKK